jgi:Zn-dependent protease
MQWTFRIGRVFGTDLKVHLTFLLLVAWWAYAGYVEGGLSVALWSGVALLALFACVVLHEFGHVLMARRFGVRTPDVILLPIGGVARLERMPDEPRQELLIALAGPAVTLTIAALLYLALQLAGNPPASLALQPDDTSLVHFLMAANVYLLLFNLIPAFPMDGGRVLRALLASRLGLLRGTRIAARLGRLLAVAGGLYALFAVNSPFLALLAFFIFVGAGAEAAAVETRSAGTGLQVAQMMVTDFRTVPIHATLAQAAELLLATEQREFPVVDNLGRTEGILTRDNLIRSLGQLGPLAAVADAMTTRAPVVAPTLGFPEALERLRASGLPALPVIDASGALVGLLTRDNISDLLLVRRSEAEAAARRH